jgi:hypothetical protein
MPFVQDSFPVQVSTKKISGGGPGLPVAIATGKACKRAARAVLLDATRGTAPAASDCRKINQRSISHYWSEMTLVMQSLLLVTAEVTADRGGGCTACDVAPKLLEQQSNCRPALLKAYTSASSQLALSGPVSACRRRATWFTEDCRHQFQE